MNFHNSGIIKIKLAIFISYSTLAHGLMSVCDSSQLRSSRCVSFPLSPLFWFFSAGASITRIRVVQCQFPCPTNRKNKVRFILDFKFIQLECYWMRRMKRRKKRNYIVSYQSTEELKNGSFHHSESTFLHTNHIVYIIWVYIIG